MNISKEMQAQLINNLITNKFSAITMFEGNLNNFEDEKIRNEFKEIIKDEKKHIEKLTEIFNDLVKDMKKESKLKKRK